MEQHQQHQQHPPVASAPPNADPAGPVTLWVGHIQPNWDEAFLYSLFQGTGECTGVKLIRNKVTGLPAGYGFADFSSHFAASEVLKNFNGKEIPGTGVTFRLNWGGGKSSGGGGSSGGYDSSGMGHSYSSSSFSSSSSSDDASRMPTLFVGDLGPECTDDLLFEAFKLRFPSIVSANAVMDPATGVCKGFGFCRFQNSEDVERALSDMTGVFVGSRAIRVSRADSKGEGQGAASAGNGNGASANAGGSHFPPPDTRNDDAQNTTVFVGNVDNSVNHQNLHDTFAPFGSIVSVKLPPGRGCGFVKFTDKQSATQALEALHGTTIGNTQVRLSWAKSKNSDAGRGGMGMGRGPSAYEQQMRQQQQMMFYQQQQAAMYYQQQQQAAAFQAQQAAEAAAAAAAKQAKAVRDRKIMGLTFDPQEFNSDFVGERTSSEQRFYSGERAVHPHYVEGSLLFDADKYNSAFLQAL